MSGCFKWSEGRFLEGLLFILCFGILPVASGRSRVVSPERDLILCNAHLVSVSVCFANVLLKAKPTMKWVPFLNP